MMLVAEIQRATLIEIMWLNMVVENSKLMSFSEDELYKSYRYEILSGKEKQTIRKVPYPSTRNVDGATLSVSV